MLNRDLLASALQEMQENLFIPLTDHVLMAEQEWIRFGQHEATKTAVQELVEVGGQALVVSGTFSDCHPVEINDAPYQVLGVDGSQVYPERHRADVNCYLLNAGGCFVSYGEQSAVTLFSHPRIESIRNNDEYDGAVTVGFVDAQREVYEYEKAIEYATTLCPINRDNRFVVMIDGTLLLWHLEHKVPALKEYFLERHLEALRCFKQKKISIAGYISLTKSKELVAMMRQLFEVIETTDSFLTMLQSRFLNEDEVTDARLLRDILRPGMRTTVFKSAARIASWYPAAFVPCFFYLHVGSEIVRVELPYWQAEDNGIVDMIAQLCYDQAMKGQGYPVVLAEAHEQAVVKAADKEFFYHLVLKAGITQRRAMTFSQKSIKKRGMSV